MQTARKSQCYIRRNINVLTSKYTVPSIHNNPTSNQMKTIYRYKTNNKKSKTEYVFGLRPVDFSIKPPLYRAPPPPPPKPGLSRYTFHFTLFIFIGTCGYFYYNNQNDSYEYWEAMQTGGVAPGTYDDDDDDDEEDDDQ